MEGLIKQVKKDLHTFVQNNKSKEGNSVWTRSDRFWAYLHLLKEPSEKHGFISRGKLKASSLSAECTVMTDRSACVTWNRKAKIATLTARAVISPTRRSNYLLGSSHRVVQKFFQVARCSCCPLCWSWSVLLTSIRPVKSRLKKINTYWLNLRKFRNKNRLIDFTPVSEAQMDHSENIEQCRTFLRMADPSKLSNLCTCIHLMLVSQV